MASGFVVAGFGEVLVVTPPIGPVEGEFGLRDGFENQFHQQATNFRNGQWDQRRVTFFEVLLSTRERITESVAWASIESVT